MIYSSKIREKIYFGVISPICRRVYPMLEYNTRQQTLLSNQKGVVSIPIYNTATKDKDLANLGVQITYRIHAILI